MAADGYFHEGGWVTDLEEDAFKMSIIPVQEILIQDKNNKFLIINSEDFQLQNLNKEQQCQPEFKFNMQLHNDSTFNGRRGRAVTLYAQKDGKTLVVSCNDKHDIRPVEMDLPLSIESTGHRAVFYLRKLLPPRFLLESSLFPSEFLGFEPDGDRVLVLRHKGQDEVDESCVFTLLKFDVNIKPLVH